MIYPCFGGVGLLNSVGLVVIEPHVPDRHAEMVRLRGVLHDLRRPIDVLVYSDASTATPRSRSGAMHPAQRYMPRSPRAGCLSKRDALDVARALLADRDDAPDHVAGFLAQTPSSGGATPMTLGRLS
jgi:hypothetical protein